MIMELSSGRFRRAQEVVGFSRLDHKRTAIIGLIISGLQKRPVKASFRGSEKGPTPNVM